jgi:hypothetical protein
MQLKHFLALFAFFATALAQIDELYCGKENCYRVLNVKE